MHYTLLCSFNSNSGWRVHKVLNAQSHSISVVVLDSKKLLSIPVVVGQMKRGHFCNPKKLLMDAVRAIQKPVRFAPIQFLIAETPAHDPSIAALRIEAACKAVQF
jgi:uncharacterized protein YraI